MIPTFGWRLQHSYAALPEVLYAKCPPTPVREPQLWCLNAELAACLGLELEGSPPETVTDWFVGNALPPGGLSIAQAYAGHQFGHLTLLGDGRALLVGEQCPPEGGRVDVQWKGAGPTPFSRRGDGRAALGPMLREFLVSEAMHALRIPTTRSLAVAATGEAVHRERPLPGALLTRVAASHIRVGTFEFAALQRDPALLRALVDYTLARHPSAGAVQTDEVPALTLLQAAVERQATLTARWLLVGFVHGVMNTDNMALSGETIDYGPCAFLDEYDVGKVFSSIDHHGRYAYGNQPAMALWNLSRLAETLLPLLDADPSRAVAQAEGILESFAPTHQRHLLNGWRAKLGLSNEEESDADLTRDLLDWMARAHADFTLTFQTLSQENAMIAPSFPDRDFHRWHARWQNRLARQDRPLSESAVSMRRTNPAVIPRNHQIEAVLNAAEVGDRRPFDTLHRVLAHPFDLADSDARFALPPTPTERVSQTFCGT